MAKKKFARGDKRSIAVQIVRSNHLTRKSSDELKDKVVGKIMKGLGFEETRARAYTNFILRNGMTAQAARKGAGGKRKAGRKATTKRSSARRKVETSAQAE